MTTKVRVMEWTTEVPAIAAGLSALGVLGAAVRYMGTVRDRRRDQATQVFATYLTKEAGGVAIIVRNLSHQPIYAIVVKAGLPPTMIDIGFLGPEGYGIVNAPPGVSEPSPPQALGFWFRDNAGRAWYRSRSGKLYQCSRWRKQRAIEGSTALEPREATGGA